MVSVVTLNSASSSTKAATGNTDMSEYGCIPLELYLWMLTLEFHIMFRVIKYYPCFDFFFFFLVYHLKF